MPEEQRTSGESSAASARGAAKTGKAIANIAKGAATGGAHGAALAAAKESKKWIAGIAILLLLPVLIVLMLPVVIFGSLFGIGTDEPNAIVDNTVLSANMVSLNTGISTILSPGCALGYPMSREDWAYVTSTAGIYLNPRRTASVGEWEYVISHCLLHLGFGHITQECKDDPLWNEACDYVVAKFLKDSHIGLPPPEFQTEFSCPVKDEIQVYQWLKEHPESAMKHTFSTMTRNRADMRWERNPGIDFTAVFGRSLQASMKDALRVSAGLPSQRMSCIYTDSVSEARDWFISSYPLLGALAASFQIIDDRDTVKRMGVQVAAISPQLQEIYINPRCNYTQMEWRFILLKRICPISLVRSGGPAAALIGRSTGGKTGSLTLVSAQLPKWRGSTPGKSTLTPFEAAERAGRTSIRSSLASVQSICLRARLWCVLRSGASTQISRGHSPVCGI